MRKNYEGGKMKKMLIVLAALTVMGAGFVMAEDQKTEPKEPSTAYMHGYNKATKGGKNTCESDYKYGSVSKKEKDRYDCNQGYRQAENNKSSNQQSTDN